MEGGRGSFSNVFIDFAIQARKPAGKVYEEQGKGEGAALQSRWVCRRAEATPQSIQDSQLGGLPCCNGHRPMRTAPCCQPVDICRDTLSSLGASYPFAGCALLSTFCSSGKYLPPWKRPAFPLSQAGLSDASVWVWVGPLNFLLC